MTETEVEKLLVSISAATRKQKADASNAESSALPYIKSSECLESSRVRAILTGKEQWKAGEEEHIARCRYCNATVKIANHQIKNPLPIPQLAGIESSVKPVPQKAQSQTSSVSKKTLPAWGKFSAAGACLFVIGLVGFSILRDNAETKLPRIAELERTSRDLLANGTRSGSDNPEISTPFSPKSTAIRSSLPTFVWKNPQKNSQYLELLSTSKNRLFRVPVQGSSWTALKPLGPGTYYWKIGDSTSLAAFKILSQDEVKEVSDQEITSSRDKARAALYLRYQLFAEAKPILNRLYSSSKNNEILPYLRIVSNSH